MEPARHEFNETETNNDEKLIKPVMNVLENVRALGSLLKTNH